MRDPKRIKRILSLLGMMWTKSPDLRLGQLLTNFGGFSGEDYYIEDNLTEEKLQIAYDKWYEGVIRDEDEE